jgi:hypothetical protein
MNFDIIANIYNIETIAKGQGIHDRGEDYLYPASYFAPIEVP